MALHEQHDGDDTSGRPGQGAHPVAVHEPAMRSRIESALEPDMRRHLQRPGAAPDDGEESQAGPRQRVAHRQGDEDGRAELDEHRRSHHPGSVPRVQAFVGGEAGGADMSEQRVVHHLHEPDEARHEQRGRGMHEKQPVGRRRGRHHCTSDAAGQPSVATSVTDQTVTARRQTAKEAVAPPHAGRAHLPVHVLEAEAPLDAQVAVGHLALER